MESEELKTQLAELHHSAFGWAMVCCRRDRHQATEVLQEAYCRILTGSALFKNDSEFSTWVFGVIRYVALEEFRKEKRQHNFDELVEERVDDSHRVTIKQQELATLIASALEQLSDRQREVIHLTFYQEMTIEQAANCLGISVGSARQHYHRGKSALQRILAHHRELES